MNALDLLNPFSGWGVTFARPLWLVLLPLIPLLAWLLGRRGRVPSVVFSSTATLRALGQSVASRRGAFQSSLFYLALALGIVALARPQAGRAVERIEASGIDIMLAMDVSRSMLAEDFFVGGQRSNRLEAVKAVTREFIEGRPNDRIGIVAFAGRPYLVSPLTLDHGWLLSNLERVQIGMVEDGTAIGSAVASAVNRLRNQNVKSKVVILLTDGDNNAGKVTPETAAEAAAALGVKVYTIGAGTNRPAPFPVGRWPNGRLVYEERLFPLDEKLLTMIAEKTGGLYQRATDTGSLQAIFEQIDKLERTNKESATLRLYRDLFHWFVFAAAALFGVEIALAHTLWRRLP